MMNKNNIEIKNSHNLIIVLIICLIVVLQTNLFTQPLAQGRDKFLGAATNSTLFRDFDKYWTQVTPGNDGKWGSVEAVRGQYNWTNLDKIYNYAKNRNILFKEHVFVWVSQQPSWISSLDSASQRQAVEDWMRNFSERYPLTTFVDVVNEPFHGLPSYSNALGGSGVTGWDWVITSFQLARKYCPVGCKLILNEYNVLHDNTVTTNYINIINLLKDRGLIDGIGIQGHYFEFRSDMNASNQYVWPINNIKTNLNRLAETRLPIYMTEFDIDEPIDANQLSQYQIYLPIFWSHPAVKGITFWGYIQGDVWNSHPNTYLLLSNGTERPALQWMRNYILSPLPPDSLSPNLVSNTPRNPILTWHSSDSAESYHVQISLNTTFASFVTDTSVADTFFQTNVLAAGTRYYWRVCGVNQYGAGDFSSTASFITGDQIVDVEEIEITPSAFVLEQNFPNPFNPVTKITYTIPLLGGDERGGLVILKVYDILGNEIETLVNEEKLAGSYEITWDAANLPSGVYFYRLICGSHTATQKMTLAK
jgi:endo-1,4-beta-xylanase